MGSVALLFLLASGPKVELTVSPRMGQIFPGECRRNGLLVTTRVHVEDPKGDLYCPEVTWEWGDGNREIHQEDCDIYQPGISSTDTWYSKQHLYCSPGVMEISILLRSATTTRKETSTVEIR